VWRLRASLVEEYWPCAVAALVAEQEEMDLDQLHKVGYQVWLDLVLDYNPEGNKKEQRRTNYR
jgi:hypothetical protein